MDDHDERVLLATDVVLVEAVLGSPSPTAKRTALHFSLLIVEVRQLDGWSAGAGWVLSRRWQRPLISYLMCSEEIM